MRTDALYNANVMGTQLRYGLIAKLYYHKNACQALFFFEIM